MMRHLFWALVVTGAVCGCTRQAGVDPVVMNGIPWYDQNGDIVNAHGACVVEDDGRYYLFGEWKSDTSNAFPGFACYSSDDLVNWRFERVVLPMQKEGIMGPNRVGERVKVMKCPKTGEYVMFMHSDDMGYKDPYTAYAVSQTIDGEYTMCGPVLFEGKPIKKWDMGTFQDSDGKGYLLIHHGPIYRLSDDYHSVEALVATVPESGESPAMFKKGGRYFLIYSNLTSWERNDNFYFSAPAIEGPWTKQGLFCPEGSLTWNSQSTFVFPLKRGNDTIPVYMGDRWSYPHQASAATYVWLPLQVEGDRVSIPAYHQFWNIHTLEPVDVLAGATDVARSEWGVSEGWEVSKESVGHYVSSLAGSALTVPFGGGRMAVTGESGPHGGYAKVSILDARRDTVYASLVDFYSKNPDKGVRIITPKMTGASLSSSSSDREFTLVIENVADRPIWWNKRGDVFGSDSTLVAIGGVYALGE